MKDFCVVGSGIAGSRIANLLAKKYSVEDITKFQINLFESEILSSYDKTSSR